jgi:fatty acid desaturase
MTSRIFPRKPKDFVKRSNIRGGLAIAQDWLAIVVLIYSSIRIHSWLLYPLAAWLIGTFQFALSESLLHEAAHYNLFKVRRWNDALDLFYGLPLFYTTQQFRLEHMIHHRFLGKPEDNLLADYEAMGLFHPGINLFWIWFCRPLLGYAGYHYALAFTLKPLRSGIRMIAFWGIVLGVFACLHQLEVLVLYWFIPLLWSCYSQLYWSEIADHYRTQTGVRSNFSRWTNFLHHNNGYHFTHHTYASIPWYMLPEATRALCPGQGDVCYGFLDIYHSIKSGSIFPEFPAVEHTQPMRNLLTPNHSGEWRVSSEVPKAGPRNRCRVEAATPGGFSAEHVEDVAARMHRDPAGS